MGHRASAVALLLVLAAACSVPNDTVPDPGSACPNPVDTAEQIRFSSVVFVGEVVSVEAGIADVLVAEIWRGPDLEPEVTVTADPDRFPLELRPGVRYLFLPATNRPPFTDHACTGTAVLTDALATLRPDDYRAVAPPPAEPPIALIAAILGGGAVLLIVWPTVLAIRRRRAPVPVWNPDHTIKDERRAGDLDDPH